MTPLTWAYIGVGIFLLVLLVQRIPALGVPLVILVTLLILSRVNLTSLPGAQSS